MVQRAAETGLALNMLQKIVSINMRNLEGKGRVILKWVLETFLWGLNVAVPTVLLPWAMAHLRTIDVEYCYSYKEIVSIIEIINVISVFLS